MITEKPWGYEEILWQEGDLTLKRIVVEEGHRLSKQYHKEKVEILVGDGKMEGGMGWEGFARLVGRKEIHRLIGPGTWIELSKGPQEDVVRLEDDYGRTT